MRKDASDTESNNYTRSPKSLLYPRKRNRKSRGKGLRTKTGCEACRLRHVKCSEERPQCRACEKFQRPCVYKNTSTTDSIANASANASKTDSGSAPQPTAGAADDDQLSPSRFSAPGEAVNVSDNVTHAALSVYGCPSTQAAIAPYASPGSSRSGPLYSAESAPLRWLDLLATDATNAWIDTQHPHLGSDCDQRSPVATAAPHANSAQPLQQLGSTSTPAGAVGTFISNDDVVLSTDEITVFQHFVQHLSTWIDVTDPGRSFSIQVSDMATRNIGLMKAILTLSSCHLTLRSSSLRVGNIDLIDRTHVVQYYSETLQYLQRAMRDPLYLRSEELLATVLVISTYEMIDGQGRGWENHLKGVFWIQNSQLIHGESHGLKKWVWWAWLRQDIWVAFTEQRKILSYYALTVPCAELDFWGLVNRSFFLLGQCVNYASIKEIEAGRHNLQERIGSGQRLWASVQEWATFFEPHDRRLPVLRQSDLFEPICINPTAASE